MHRRVLILIPALLPAILACSIFLGGPAYPDPPVPVSTDAASGLQSVFESAVASASESGTLTVQLTETELTSYLDARLAELTDPPISKPQVTLRNGSLQVFGTAQSGLFVANVSLTAQCGVDPNGQPLISVTKAEFGPAPAPSELTDAMSSLLQEMLTGSFGPAAIGFRLESITIADGKMTLTGRIK